MDPRSRLATLVHSLLMVGTMRIVLISPSTGERAALEELLRLEGHQVVSVQSRQQGLAMATAHRPHLVLADVRLPVFDGSALLHALSTLGLGSPPRLLLLSSRTDSELEKLGVGCLAKPVDFAELLQIMATDRSPGEAEVA